jgi:hypothetical protein
MMPTKQNNERKTFSARQVHLQNYDARWLSYVIESKTPFVVSRIGCYELPVTI